MRPLVASLAVLVVTTTASAAPKPGVPENTFGFKVPVEFRPECAHLTKLAKAPADLTVKGFFACLTDASRAKLDRSYRRKLAKRPVAGAPADLNALIATHGTKAVSAVRMRDLVAGTAAKLPRGAEYKVDGVPVSAAKKSSPASPAFGFDPTKCDKSCLSMTVDVVNDTRTIGYRAAWVGPKASPSGRLLDEVFPGTFPDHSQHDLKNSELVASGCGPVSAVNLLEWWNIPVYNGSKHLTSFDSRTEFIAGQMNTLAGIDYTDDDDLLDFMEKYPKEQYNAGRIPGYPGYHAMEGDPEAIKVMLSYLARGYPVIALYSTGSESLHWAMITGYEGGKLHIANATDLTLSDFYAQWDSWDSLSWYAWLGADLVVTEDTFFAYTGWHDTGELQAPRYAARSSSSNPGYTGSGSTYRWRYCVGASDGIGGAEADHVSGWSNEPSGAPPGYCMYIGGMTSISLTASSGGTVSSKKGDKLKVSVTGNSALNTFLDKNPGAHCDFLGKAGSTWKQLTFLKCSDASAFEHSYTNDGQYSELMFLLHAADLAHVTWKVTTTK